MIRDRQSRSGESRSAHDPLGAESERATWVSPGGSLRFCDDQQLGEGSRAFRGGGAADGQTEERGPDRVRVTGATVGKTIQARSRGQVAIDVQHGVNAT